MPLGKVEKLRAAAARAVWGKARSLSVALAMAVGYGGTQDPEMYLLHQAVVAMQRLLRIWPDLGQRALQLTRDFQEQSGRPFGPATTLARLLNINGWTLRSTSAIKGPGLEQIDLSVSTSRDARASLDRAWQVTLCPKLAHRQGLHSIQAPDVDAFRIVCNNLGPQAVGSLGRVFFGGFHSKAAQAQWDPFEEAGCRFCGQPDTKWHRIFDCPAHGALRRPFQPVLDWVQRHAPHWPYCAFPEQHQDVGVLRLVWGSRKVGLSPPPVSLIHTFSLSTFVVYTDGACANNACPAARHAAFSVVLDCAPNSAPEALLQFWRAEARVPPNYHVVQQGLVPGRQSIDRAELLALLHVCHFASEMPQLNWIAVTDSQYALEAIASWDQARVAQGQPLPPNYDLFTAMGVTSAPRNLQLRKVKSHQDPAVASLPDVADILGNMAADHAAARARQQEFPCVLDILDEVVKWHETSKEAFELYCSYNRELTKTVAVLDKSTRNTLNDTAASATEPDPTEVELAKQWLCNSIGGATAVPPLELPNHWPTNGHWPQAFLAALWVWRNGILWPAATRDKQIRGAGITFFELLLNFAVTTRTLPPVKSHETGSLCDPVSPEGILLPIGIRELIANLTSAADFLGRACGVPFWPIPRHHRIYSLVVLQETNPRKGLRQRPGLQEEESTARLIARMLKTSNQAEILREATLRGTLS